MNAQEHLVRWHNRSFAAEVPISAYLELTHRCNLHCIFCCNRKVTDGEPLKLSVWRRVVADLRSLGTLYVTLTGGEPLVHPDFFEIASAVREQHMAIRLLSNGALIDGPTAERIAALHPLSVEMSLHGAHERTHDATTGVEGSFDALWGAIGVLLNQGVNVALKTPVTALNVGEIDQVIGLCERRNIPLRLDSDLTARDDGDPSPLQHAVQGDDLDRFCELMAEKDLMPTVSRRAGFSNCGLGRSTLTICPDGEVYPCILWRSSSYGNIRESSLRALWQGPLRHEMAALSDLANDSMLELGEPCSLRPYCPATAGQRKNEPQGMALCDDDDAFWKTRTGREACPDQVGDST